MNFNLVCDLFEQIGFKVVHPKGEKIFCMCVYVALVEQNYRGKTKSTKIHSVKLEIFDNRTMIREKHLSCGDYR